MAICFDSTFDELMSQYVWSLLSADKDKKLISDAYVCVGVFYVNACLCGVACLYFNVCVRVHAHTCVFVCPTVCVIVVSVYFWEWRGEAPEDCVIQTLSDDATTC